MIHSARHTVPVGSDFRLILKFWDGQEDVRTTCEKIVITTDCGRPRGSILKSKIQLTTNLGSTLSLLFLLQLAGFFVCSIVVNSGAVVDPRGRPQSRPVVITIFTQSVRQSVRPSVRPSVPKLQNQATITAGRDCARSGRVDH